MKRNVSLKFYCLLWVLLFGWSPTVWVFGESASQGVHVRPYLQNPSTDGMTIMWETRQSSIGMVEYGRHSDNPQYDGKSSEAAPSKIHRVRITSLQPGTKYAYRVKVGKSVFTDVFTTKPASTDRVRFVIIGDDKNWGDRWQNSPLPRHLESKQPDFILILGDLANNGLRHDNWPQHWRRWASIMGHIPIIPCRGNHERDGRKDPDNDFFAKYHDLPGGEPLTSFDWGPAHFAMISFTHWGQAPRLFDKDLSKTDKKWKITGAHFPIYGTGYFSPTDSRKALGYSRLVAVFDKHNVDLFGCGHNHMYERCFALRKGKRDDRKGTVYLVQGGRVEGNYPDYFSAKVAKDMDFPHYTLVEVSEDMMELRSYGLARGEGKKGTGARVVEFDGYIRWRDESQPQALLAGLDRAEGDKLVANIQRLGAMMYAPAAPAIVGYLKSDDPKIRHAAGSAIENIADAGVAAQLLGHLDHPDLIIQKHVARSLEAAMPSNMSERIARLALDETRDTTVRMRLLGALLLHGPAEKSLEVALIILNEKKPRLRRRAADVVKRTAGKEQIPILLRLFKNEPDGHIAVCLAWGLNRITGAKVDLKKAGRSRPGQRQNMIDRWKNKTNVK
ncbi:MAG: metallophosphoesterase [Planctomycetota bacterium]|jgi:hypothetical protein